MAGASFSRFGVLFSHFRCLLHFEFTHELAWNTFKDFLSARSSSAKLYGSSDATRAAFAAELIEDGEAWMRMPCINAVL